MNLKNTNSRRINIHRRMNILRITLRQIPPNNLLCSFPTFLRGAIIQRAVASARACRIQQNIARVKRIGNLQNCDGQQY